MEAMYAGGVIKAIFGTICNNDFGDGIMYGYKRVRSFTALLACRQSYFWRSASEVQDLTPFHTKAG